MTSPRIVSVFGATGLQGAAVARALLKDGTFHPRAISRDPGSEASLKLKSEGIEGVKGDTLDKASLVAALRGSEAVFAVTVPLFPVKAEGEGPNEIVQGKNMVDAAKAAGVKFFFFSSLPHFTNLSGGKYKQVLFFDQKFIVEEYLKSSGLANVSIHLGMFLENYWQFGWMRKNENGFDLNIIPGAHEKQAFSWVERDVPAVMLAMLKSYTDPSKNSFLGKTYPVITGAVTYADLADLTAQVLGAPVTITKAPPIGIPELDEMYAALGEYEGGIPATHVPEFDVIGVKLGTFKEFVETEVKSRFG
ncbi:NmrA domain-containing protein, partial [Favolaschia claudopus]